MSPNSDAPFAVLVSVEIAPDRLEEFHKLIKMDAEESRKEPGCLGFDVLQNHESTTKFVFYEMYKSMEAIEFHKSTPHYAAWAAFKETGAVVSYSVQLTRGLHLSHI